MNTFHYDDTSPLGILSQAAEYVFTHVMPDEYWRDDPYHAQAMLFALALHGQLGIRLSMIEREDGKTYRLSGVQGEGCIYEEAAGLLVELRPNDGGGSGHVLAGTDAQLIWLIMMIDLPRDLVKNRTAFPAQIGAEWIAQYLNGEAEMLLGWYMVEEDAA